MNSWLDSNNENEVFDSKLSFWENLRSDIENGTFWGERIKKVRGEPAKRLSIAVNNLPLPAAFREALISLRAIIRQKKKEKSDYSDELALLYWFAAIDSFCIPYSESLQQPGFNVMESIPGKILKSLPFSFFTLGYEELPLLNKTDKKWLVESWGEPDKHTTLHKMHIEVWKKYEKALPEKQRRKRENMLKSIL